MIYVPKLRIRMINMKNIGLIELKNKDAGHFTTDTGIKLRRLFNPLLRSILKLAAKHKIIVENYPKLTKGKPYIFTSTHSFAEDAIANLASIDRNAYILFGSTDQLEHNPQVYAAWLNGLIYVNRREEISRKDSVKKMERILNSGSSVFLFPKGGWNNTENLLVLPLFSGPWLLSQRTKTPVVPVSAFCEQESDTVFLNYGNPLDLFCYPKDEAISLLWDALATMTYEAILKHGTKLIRSECSGDLHMAFCESRKQEYQNVSWTKDNWDEELTTYCKKGQELPKDVVRFVENVSVTPSNAAILAPFLMEYERYQKYDLKQYLRQTWNLRKEAEIMEEQE